MNLPEPELNLLPGTFEGSGGWIDIVGDAKPYRVRQTIARDGDDLTVDYVHDFIEEGTTTSGLFVFRRTVGFLFEVLMLGNVVGNGYMFGPHLHFHLKVGERFVQTSYEVTPTELAVNGSSTSNSQGRYVAWHEALVRQ